MSDMPAYTEQMKDELKTQEVFKDYGDISALGQGVIDLKKTVKEHEDADKARIEAETKVEKAPDHPDKYQFDPPVVPDGMKADEEMSKWFRSMAHQMDLTNTKARLLYAGYNKYMIEKYGKHLEDRDKVFAEQVTKLIGEAGGEDKYKEQILKGDKALEALGGPGGELKKFLQSTEVDGMLLSSHPTIVKFMIEVGKRIGEDTQPGGKPPAGALREGEKEGVFFYEKSPEFYKDKQ